jgi:hypothetical protein
LGLKARGGGPLLVVRLLVLLRLRRGPMAGTWRAFGCEAVARARERRRGGGCCLRKKLAFGFREWGKDKVW